MPQEASPRGPAPLAANDEARDPRYATRRVLARMWRDHLRADLGPIAAAALLLAAEGAALGLAARMLEPLFDRVLVGGQSSAIPVVAAVVLAIFGVRAVSGLLSTVILTAVASRGILAIQRRMTAHAMTLDAENLRGVPPGALIERVQGDANRLRGVWNGLITNVFRDAVALVALMAAAISIDPVWTLAALVGVPLLMLPAVVVQRYVKRKAGTVQALSAERVTRLDEIFHGLRPVRLNAMEDYQTRRFEAVADRLNRAQIRAAGAEGSLPALVDLATGVGFVAVLVLGGAQVAAGDKTVGEFMAFFAAMTLAFQPLRKLGGTSAKIQTAGASLARIYRLLDERPTIRPPADPLPLPPGPPRIAFREVRVSHGGAPALRGATFTAEAGEVTALVGASGAGKSTLFDALTRLVPLEGGEIALAGVPVDRIAPGDLRAAIGVVSQDALLFDDTIRENVTLGRPVDEARLRAALDAANVSDFLARLPGGLDAPAGVRGSNLSGGQRQRVAIARALLRDAPVLLLDEATSALDARSEALVQGALDRAAQGRTTLVIAHRLSTVRGADRIVVLDAGRVVETGTHDALLAEGGAYAALHALAG